MVVGTASSIHTAVTACVDEGKEVADLLVRSITGVLTMPMGPMMSV